MVTPDWAISSTQTKDEGKEARIVSTQSGTSSTPSDVSQGTSFFMAAGVDCQMYSFLSMQEFVPRKSFDIEAAMEYINNSA